MKYSILKITSLFKPKRKKVENLLLDKDFFKNSHIYMEAIDYSHIQATELKFPNNKGNDSNPIV